MKSVNIICMYSPELGIDYYQYVSDHSKLSTTIHSFKAIIGPSIPLRPPHMILKAIIPPTAII